MRQPLAVALLHHPVLNRRGEVVTTSVTNLDLHDIARTARTYGVDRFYVVMPVTEQRLLIDRLLDHWRDGYGATYNPDRRDALSLVETVATLEEAIERWSERAGRRPLPVLTGASRSDGVPVTRCRQWLQEQPLLLIFGTGWGLAPALFGEGWPVVEPIRGVDGYNHLPVRSAAAILLDRLCGSCDN